ncbi:hypothetical protein PVAND_011751 [Polypedilum vanderplanki]|uniref:Uncharacterized protein n=1 Tax=Polypedilum vanderplanki TaxID=319348 RepID=A0A9J6CLD2_POLVA|nr:hypothetical protein PVAND_011751 [Polypedilum vanderplanki]
MSKIKHNFIFNLLVYFVLLFEKIQCKSIKTISEYDSHYSDYFDTTVSESIDDNKLSTTINFETTQNILPVEKENESIETDDDGVTCSPSNVTKVLSDFDLENSVLVLFRLNVTANDRELVFFLNLARRFSEASSLFIDHRFIVVTMDHSSEIVKDFIETERYPSDIIVIDDEDYPDLGFVIDFDELHVYVVDQCEKLAYIIVPPWSSAQHPYVKAALLSTILDLPCDCSSEFMSNTFDEIDPQLTMRVTERIESNTENILTMKSTIRVTSDSEENDIENIEQLLDNANNINESISKTENSSLPLRIIFSSPHVHFDNESNHYLKYEEVIFKSDDENYHMHFNSPDILLDIFDERLLNFTENNIFVGNISFNNIKSQFPNKKILVNRLGYFYKVLNNMHDESIYEIMPLEYDIIRDSPKIQIFGVKHHYKQLNKWLFYKI